MTERSGDERALFERGPVVIFRWRNAPGWPVEYVSANVLDVLGYAAAEFLSGAVSYGSLVVPEDLERVGREVAEGTASGAPSFAHEPYRVRRKDGEVRSLYDYTHVVRDSEGRATHYLGYVFDVTSHVLAEAERHALELRLLRSQKLESLGLLAGGVAHDFNNLLTGILGQASLARRVLARAGSDDLPRVARGLEQIEQLAERATELTQKLLAYAGMKPLVMAPVDLGAVVTDMASILDVVITRRATVTRTLRPALPSVMADRGQLQQVLMNLLTNASDALEALADGSTGTTGSTGTIALRTGVCTLAAAAAEPLGLPAGRYVELEVADTGCGMSEQTRARLFEPFFTTKAAGRGLGMAAVLGIVRGHHGAITVASTLGEGSRFTVLLPAIDAPARPRPAAPEVSGWRGRGTVLVADDQRAIRATLALLLRSFGFACVEAADGAAALAAFREGAERASAEPVGEDERIVLALLDMTMPVMSGVETMRALRAMAPELPVILSSGFSLDDVGAEVAGQRVVFLQKPYRLADLEAALRSALGEAVGQTAGEGARPQ